MKNAIYSIMAGPRDYHTKWSKSENDKYHMKSLIWGTWNMAQMILSTKQKHTDIENRLVVAKEEEVGGWKD